MKPARRLGWEVRVGTLLVRLLGATWRRRTIGQEALDALRRDGTPVIFAIWHGTLLPLLYHHRGEGISVLISEHRDGELIARIAERLGYRTVRGSTSRGASRALVGLVRELAEGHDIAVTPDGPRGPARTFAPGALIAAQRAGVPLLLLGLHATRAWRLGTWDGFVIPKPFSRVTVTYALAHVTGVTPRDAADEAPRFQALLDEMQRRAGA